MIQATQVRHTACPLDCPDGCRLEVTVADNRVVKIDGALDQPLTAGFICGKVRRFADHLYGDDRLLEPARRVGPKGEAAFEPISWDDALSEICDRIRSVRDRHGAESILPFCYGGSNGFLTQEGPDARLFRRLGASQLARTVCAAPSSAAARGLYGTMHGVAFDDFVHARLIVVWGANPSASNIHLVPYINEARKAGAKLVVVDPRATPLARQADLHLAVRPGGDLALALAVIRQLFESGAADRDFLAEHTTGADELRRRAKPWTFARAADRAGVAAADIERFADLYATINPAILRCGWGLERNRHGGSACAAVLALPAVAGKFGVRGGGYTHSNSAAWKLTSHDAAHVAQPATRTINMNRLGTALTGEADPPVNLLFVYNANPLATIPHQTLVREGLARDDLFTVVFDQVVTDTARYADIILPATTFLEHDELRRHYGSTYLTRPRAVIEPCGEARPNYEVFGELCQRLDLAEPSDPQTAEQLVDATLASHPEAAQIQQQLDEQGTARPACGSHPVQFVDVFPLTPDRRVHLVPDALDREAPAGLYTYDDDASPGGGGNGHADRYPLTLISPALARTVSSTFGQLIEGQVPVELNPDDAAGRGISENDRVRITSRYGEVHCHATLNADLRTGVALLPKGLWSRHTLNGNTANALAPDTLTDLGGGACFNDARVEIALLD